MSPLKQWQRQFKGNLCLLANALAQSRIRVRVSSFKRSRRQQEILLQNPQGYPVALPGRSQHQYSLAVDLSVSPKTALASAGHLWLQMGGWWSPSDPVHFAFFNPSQWSALLATCGPRATSRPKIYDPYGGWGPVVAPGTLPPEVPLPTLPIPPMPLAGGAAPPPVWVTAPWNAGAPVGGSLTPPSSAPPVSTTMAGSTATSVAVVPGTVSRGLTIPR